MSPQPMLAEVGRYYAQRLAAHGPSPQGVDWNGAESQRLRFAQVLRVCEAADEFSLNDIGCGYGALFDYLNEHDRRCDYLGADISEAMIAKANELHHQSSGCRFVVGASAGRIADYAVASGIFNVKLSAEDAAWHAHILETLQQIDAASTRGFAFNCLTRYSDAALTRDYLFYADPCEMFDYCKRRFSRNVALLHDYGLYEFTIIVRKAAPR
jgi:SAM-dependent methyltransferase